MDATDGTSSTAVAVVRAIPDDAVHRICSGQVVVDLAVAAKELVENALDAGASIIEIRLIDYGCQRLEVVDNGIGVPPQSYAGLARKYHTSKLTNFEDLLGVQSYGFRGEALSSICAVADVTICTRIAEQQVGSLLVYNHEGELAEEDTVPRDVGTTVTVDNLFVTIPVRAVALKRNCQREYRKLIRVLEAYAMVNHSVRFHLSNTVNGRKTSVMATDGTSMKNSVFTVFGSRDFARLQPIQVTQGDCCVTGWITEPRASDAKKGDTTISSSFHVRPVDNAKLCRIINECYRKAVDTCYKRSSLTQRAMGGHRGTSAAPSFVLDVRLDGAHVDVNVTPDKRTLFLTQEEQTKALFRSIFGSFFNTRADTEQAYDVADGSLSLSSSLGRNLFLPGDSSLQRAHSMPQPVPLDARSHVSPTSGLSPSKSDPGPALRAPNGGQALAAESPRTTGGAFARVMARAHGHLRKAVPTSEGIGASSPTTTTMGASDVVTLSDVASASTRRSSATHAPLPLNKGENPFSAWSFRDTETPEERRRRRRAAKQERTKRLRESNPTLQRIREEVGTILGASPSQDTFMVPGSSVDSDGDAVTGSTSGGLGTASLLPVAPGVQRDGNIIVVDDQGPLMDRIRGARKRVKALDSSESMCTDALTSVSYADTWEDEGDCEEGIAIDMTFLSEAMKVQVKHRRRGKGNPSLSKAHPSFREFGSDVSVKFLKSYFGHLNIIGQFNHGFIVSSLGERELFIIDQHASDEKCTYERLLRETQLSSQRLLQPEQLSLPVVDELDLKQHVSLFARLGFALSVDETAASGRQVRILGYPVTRHTQLNAEDMLETLALIREHGSDTALQNILPTKLKAVFASRACRSSIMIGQPLSRALMRSITRKMTTLDSPWNCPHGRPTMRHLYHVSRQLTHAYQVEGPFDDHVAIGEDEASAKGPKTAKWEARVS